MAWIDEVALPWTPEGQSNYDRVWLSPIMTIDGAPQVYIVDRGNPGEFWRYNLQTQLYTELAPPLHNGQYCNRTLVPDDVDNPTKLYMPDEYGSEPGLVISVYDIADDEWSSSCHPPLFNLQINYSNLVGSFSVGETIIGGTSGATAFVVTDIGTAMATAPKSGEGVSTFIVGEQIRGEDSGATADIDSETNLRLSLIYTLVHEDANTIYAWVGASEGDTLTISGITYGKTSNVRCIKWNPAINAWTIFGGASQPLGAFGEMTGRCAAKNATDIYCGGVGVGAVEDEKYYSKYNLAGDSYTNHAPTDSDMMFAHSYDKDKLAYFESGGVADHRFGYLDTADDSNHDDQFPENPDKDVNYDRICGINNAWNIAIAYVKNTAPRLMSFAHIIIPAVTTDPASAVSAIAATLNGTLDDDGDEACDCGFEWGESIAYGNTTPTQSRTTGQTFAQTITGLDPNKTYHFRALATNGAGTSYGADRTFTTLGALATVTTDPATALAAIAATLNGILDHDGGEACECGFEWGLDTGYGVLTPTESKTIGESFSQTIGGLQPGTTYHFRAFARNSFGTGYGTDRSFTTALVINRAYALAREEL